MMEYIDKVTPTHNVYFCVNVMSSPRRKKENAIPQNLVWADLDTCRPDKVEIPPQCVIESSPGRFQALWRLDRKIDPYLASNYSKRIAYAYADQGADKSGHDITQLLRVPSTFNFKYELDEVPVVELRADIDATLTTDIFEALPIPDPSVDIPDIAIPSLDELPSLDMILYRYRPHLEVAGVANAFARYVGEEPPEDWSGHMWRLLLLCFEMDMTAEEAFVVAINSKCNKYERDNRPIIHLWREVLKAEVDKKAFEILIHDHRKLIMPPLLSQAEEDTRTTTIIDDYIDWANDVTDAAPEFHEICCTTLLSILTATTLRLPTSRNIAIVPNLWALILGDSTLTRKTTCMNMAMDFVMQIDKDLIISSEATMEGLMTNLALRPKMVSVFYRDEISGFFDSVQRKDYLTGMQETMTQLYDVPRMLKRILKKDTYVVSEPIFIFFGGGTPDRMFSLITESYYTSGFMARFLVMHAEGDLTRFRPTGPPKTTNLDKRDALLSTFQALYSMYTTVQISTELHDGQRMLTTPDIEVEFTPEMWQRLGEMEYQLVDAAQGSPESPKALPTFSRMAGSVMKLTMLLAAARQEPVELKIKAEMTDLINAAYYIQKWGRHSVELMRNSGAGADENKLLSIYRSIEKRPGVLRSEIMRRHRMNARDMEAVEETLIQRMMVSVQRKGRARSYWPIGR